MKTKSSSLGAALIRRLGLPIGLLLCQTLPAVVTFTDTGATNRSRFYRVVKQ
jgi:hypothetical protein